MNLEHQELLKQKIIEDQKTVVDSEVSNPVEPQVGKSENTMKEKIAALEAEISSLSNSKPYTPATQSATSPRVYDDEYGNETFYYKNISGGHIVLSDLAGGIKIEIGDVVDLLQYADVEAIRKSRDLKITSNPRSGVAWLKRLTEGEYFEEKSKIAENLKRKLALQRQVAQDAQAIEATVTPPMSMPVSPSQTISNSIKTAEVRTDIQSKLHKLSLFFDSNPSVAQYGIDPISFIEWADAAQLSHDEIDMILGHPSVMKSPDIKTALLKKKASL